MKIKKKPKYNKDAHIRGALRRIFSRSPFVKAAKDKVRRESVKYNKDGSISKKPSVEFQCYICHEWFHGKDIQVDHIDPVIPATGFTDWNNFIERLFCSEDNLKVICKTCHQVKTNKEKDARKLNKTLNSN